MKATLSVLLALTAALAFPCCRPASAQDMSATTKANRDKPPMPETVSSYTMRVGLDVSVIGAHLKEINDLFNQGKANHALFKDKKWLTDNFTHCAMIVQASELMTNLKPVPAECSTLQAKAFAVSQASELFAKEYKAGLTIGDGAKIRTAFAAAQTGSAEVKSLNDEMKRVQHQYRD